MAPRLACRAWFAGLAAGLAAAGCTAQLGRQATRDMNASIDMEAYRARAPEVDGPLTLHDALDYAARYNIEVWIAAHERKFQHELATQSLLKMLPSLLVGEETRHRSELDASSSQSLATGEESLEPSFSSDRTTRRWDVSATWNLLDFGISFLRARQQTNRVSVAMERERRVRQNLALEVTRAWWQAVTAREAAAAADRVGEQVFALLEKISREIDEKTLSRIEGLKRETALLEQQEELRRYKRLYLAAKTELAKLIGLPPGTPFTLAAVDLDQPVAPPTFAVEELEWEALRSRPELFEKDLEQAISRDEAHVALAGMFPNVSLLWRYDWDDNRFLALGEWNTIGLRATWDLLTIPQQIQQRQAIKLQTELVAKRRTAIAVAILTQLYLSLIDYDEAAERHQITRLISDKHRSLLEAVQSAAQEGKSHGGESLDHQMKYLKARARHLAACANLMVSHTRVLNTIGREPQSEDDATGNEVSRDQAQHQEHTDE